ncbi:hypothetical protein [Streptomyces sp. NPDC090036]
MMDRFRRHRRAAFEHVTADWTERERIHFARLMLKYVDAQNALRHR